MLKRNRLFHVAAALALGAALAIAPAVRAQEAGTKELNAAAQTMTKELETLGLGLTPEKQKAVDAAMQKHMAGVAPEMEAMGKTIAQSMNSPEMRESMDKVAKEMSGVVAKQLPVMMQAMQPMLSDMLPRMLRMQADMLQILFTPPSKEAKSK
jgi:hypothetical protein